MNPKVIDLIAGKTIITSELGNSMFPRIKSGQKHKLAPATWEEVEVGDVVFCKVKGRLFTHLVYDKNPQRGLHIGNMRGRMNGWTKRVYGKVIEVL